jgi:hypothetical protein
MLPFIKKRNMASVIIRKDKDGDIDDGSDAAYADEGLKQACSDILRAISAGDADAMAGAFKAAFQLCDAAPHVEGDHE